MMSSNPLDSGTSRATPASRPRMLLVSVTKNALPWVPREVDTPTDVASDDRVIDNKGVREDQTHRAHLVRYEMHKPIILHPINRLQCFTASQPEFNAAPEKKMAETIHFERSEPQGMDTEQVCDSHELTVEKEQVGLIKTKEIKKEVFCRPITTVRASVTKPVEKPPPQMLEIEKIQVSLIQTREINKEDIGCTIESVRVPVITPVEKPPLYEIIDDDDED